MVIDGQSDMTLSGRAISNPAAQIDFSDDGAVAASL